MGEGKRKKLLIVDDEPLIIEFMTSILTKKLKYEVASATSGAEALEILKSSKPDAILMGIMMPGLNGWETIRRIKAEQETKDIPVIVVSIVHKREIGKLDQELGVAAYVEKPFEIDNLCSTVHRVAS